MYFLPVLERSSIDKEKWLVPTTLRRLAVKGRLSVRNRLSNEASIIKERFLKKNKGSFGLFKKSFDPIKYYLVI